MLLSPVLNPFKEGSNDSCLPLPVASSISHHVHPSMTSDSRWIDPIWSDGLESQLSFKEPLLDSAKELQSGTKSEDEETTKLPLSILKDASPVTTCLFDIDEDSLSQLFPSAELQNELDMGNLSTKSTDDKANGSDDSLLLDAPEIQVVIHVEVEGEEENSKYPCFVPNSRKRKYRREIVYQRKRTRKSVSLTARSPSPLKFQHLPSPAPSSSSLSSPPSSSQSKSFSPSRIPLSRKLSFLPPNVPINEAFPRFYTRYPPGDLYTPTHTRGKSVTKEARCNLCPTPSWHQTKVSAYWYHMNYYHGISSILKRPFSPPIAFRKGKAKNERVVGAGTVRLIVVEGLCHQCAKWISLQGVKDMDVKVPEIYWWKHAQKCHRTELT